MDEKNGVDAAARLGGLERTLPAWNGAPFSQARSFRRAASVEQGAKPLWLCCPQLAPWAGSAWGLVLCSVYSDAEFRAPRSGCSLGMGTDSVLTNVL